MVNNELSMLDVDERKSSDQNNVYGELIVEVEEIVELTRDLDETRRDCLESTQFGFCAGSDFGREGEVSRSSGRGRGGELCPRGRKLFGEGEGVDSYGQARWARGERGAGGAI